VEESRSVFAGLADAYASEKRKLQEEIDKQDSQNAELESFMRPEKKRYLEKQARLEANVKKGATIAAAVLSVLVLGTLGVIEKFEIQ
jgi:hypothetical protein